MLAERHAPFKKRFVRENKPHFINRKLRKTIYTKSKLTHNFCKSPTEGNTKSTKYNEANASLKKFRKIVLL